MKLLFSLTLVLIVAISGCSHKPAVTKHFDNYDAPSQHNFRIITASLDDNQTNEQETVGDEFFDDDFNDFEEEDYDTEEKIADPLYVWNKAIFHFNDKVYFWILKPLCNGYKKVTPKIFRTSIKNFFNNLAFPIRFANSFLQGKIKAAGSELSMFLVNTTAGGLGFADLSKKFPEFQYSEEDLGQTLGSYGIGDGFYIVLPFLGPSTLRDSVGSLGDYFLNPIHYVEPWEASIELTAGKTINNTSFRIGDYEALKDAAFEPYEAFRDAYIQYRKKKIKE